MNIEHNNLIGRLKALKGSDQITFWINAIEKDVYGADLNFYTECVDALEVIHQNNNANEVKRAELHIMINSHYEADYTKLLELERTLLSVDDRTNTVEEYFSSLRADNLV